MKKLLVSSLMILAISSTSFAKMHDFEKEPKKPLPPHLHKMKERDCRRDPELERAKIMIEEKKLQVRKELLNEKPDWNKIEQLNIDVATQEAKHKTLLMKKKFEATFNEDKVNISSEKNK